MVLCSMLGSTSSRFWGECPNVQLLDPSGGWRRVILGTGVRQIKPPARCRSFHYLCSRLGEKSAADKGGTREVTVQRLRDVDEMVFFDPS